MENHPLCIVVCKVVSVARECATTYAFLRFDNPAVHVNVVEAMNGWVIMTHKGREFRLRWEINPKSTPEHVLRLKEGRPIMANMATQTPKPAVTTVAETAATTAAAMTRELEHKSEVEKLRSDLTECRKLARRRAETEVRLKAELQKLKDELAVKAGPGEAGAKAERDEPKAELAWVTEKRAEPGEASLNNEQMEPRAEPTRLIWGRERIAN